MSTNVKVAINGVCGRMGAALLDALKGRSDMTLSAAFDRDDSPRIGREAIPGIKIDSGGNAGRADYDVLIDFSLADASVAVLKQCAEAQRMAVVGTTGFSERQQAEIETFSRTIPIVQAPNMSLGVNACFALLKQAATILRESDVEVDVSEAHHKGKRDAPSGTALRMGRMVTEGLAEGAQEGSQGRRPGERVETGALIRDGIAYHVIRAGDLAGEHTVMFTLPGEQIELTHRSSGRSNFARGALTAARWLSEKKRNAGLYGMQDVLGICD